jgi:hypothetical protein
MTRCMKRTDPDERQVIGRAYGLIRTGPVIWFYA